MNANYIKNHPKKRAFEAGELCYWANVDFCSNNGGSIDDADKFQKYFGGEYHIIVY